MSEISWRKKFSGTLHIRITGIGSFMVAFVNESLSVYFSQAYVVLTGEEILEGKIESNWRIKEFFPDKATLIVMKKEGRKLNGPEAQKSQIEENTLW